jgi:hypothetical protein
MEGIPFALWSWVVPLPFRPTLRFTGTSSHDYDGHAMPEANVLYSVTAVVVLGLIVWVVVVLRTAKEPWVRAPGDAASGGGTVEDELVRSAAAASRPGPALDADSTARATPVAIASEGRARHSKPPEGS